MIDIRRHPPAPLARFAAWIGLLAAAPLTQAVAQEKAAARAAEKAPDGAQGSQEAARSAAKGAKKALRLEEFTIEGRIQKPQAFFILPRSNLNYEIGDRKESLLPKTQRSLEKEPF